MASAAAMWNFQRQAPSSGRSPAFAACIGTRTTSNGRHMNLSYRRPFHQRASLPKGLQSHQPRTGNLAHLTLGASNAFLKPFIRPFDPLRPNPLGRRFLTAATIFRRPDFHRTYFQRDSTPFTPSSSSSLSPLNADTQLPYATYSWQHGNAKTSSTPASFFWGVFFALPLGTLLSMYLLTAGYVPGWSASASSEVLEEMSEALSALQEGRETITGLNAASYRVQRLLADMMTPSLGIKLVRDDALLAANPPTLSSGHVLSSDDALLLQVVDSRGDIRALVLAFQKPPPASGSPAASRASDWQVEFAVSDWLEDTSKRLHAQGRNAYPGVPLIIYTPDYFGVLKRSMEGFIWTRSDSRDFPPGWPLRQLRETIPASDEDEG